MFSHTLATLSLTCVLMLGVIGTASAHDADRWGDRSGSGPCAWSDWNACGGHKSFANDPSAPELDPTLLGSGVTILVGGMFLLNERRRNRK
jgi:hypothetical protein